MKSPEASSQYMPDYHHIDYLVYSLTSHIRQYIFHLCTHNQRSCFSNFLLNMCLSPLSFSTCLHLWTALTLLHLNTCPLICTSTHLVCSLSSLIHQGISHLHIHNCLPISLSSLSKCASPLFYFAILLFFLTDLYLLQFLLPLLITHILDLVSLTMFKYAFMVLIHSGIILEQLYIMACNYILGHLVGSNVTWQAFIHSNTVCSSFASQDGGAFSTQQWHLALLLRAQRGFGNWQWLEQTQFSKFKFWSIQQYCSGDWLAVYVVN